MIFGIIPVSFRFRGKLRRLAQIYQCFRDNPDVALHPAQISRQTGMNLADVSVMLNSTHELFVRLPRRKDGLTRYRLTSTTAARSPEDVEKLLIKASRRESILFYVVTTMVFLILLIVVILIAPSL